jgi:ABC-type glycerol-3-phosphate transport system substrate-binding protein
MATRLTRRGLLGSAGAAGAVAAATTLAGCAQTPDAGGGGAATGGAPARGPVSLEWTSWATDDYGKFREQERIDIWKQLNPDSTVSVTMNNFGGDYVQKLTALLVAGTGPDVFRLAWANVFPFMEQGYAAELEPYFKKHPKSWLARPDL